jgi:hypothetical protein
MISLSHVWISSGRASIPLSLVSAAGLFSTNELDDEGV